MRKALLWRLALSAGLGGAALHCGGGARPAPESDPPVEEAGRDAGPGDDVDADDAGSADAPVDVPLVDASMPTFSTSRTQIDFGQVGCGKKGQPITFSLNNTGATSFAWSSKLLGGATSQFKITPSGGTLAPFASATITVEMNDVPFPGTTSAGFYDDILTLSAGNSATQAGPKTTADIPIKLTAKGAVVRFSPSAVDFGAVALNQNSTASFAIINDGNAEVELNLSNNNTARFQTTPPGPVIIPAGKSTSRDVKFTAVDVQPQTGLITLTDTNPLNALCAPLPATGLSLTGIGSNGSATISPSSISFGENGLVDCGTQASSKTISIHNSGNAAFDWNAKLSSGDSVYTLTPKSGTVQPNQTTNVQVIPKPIPQESLVTSDLYAGTVEISTTAVNDPVHIVALHETARGIRVKSSLTQALDFGGVKIATTATKTFSLTNEGNVPVSVSLGISDAAFRVTPANFLLAPNAPQAPVIDFTPSAAASYDGNLVVTAPATPARCLPLPSSVTVKGVGTNSVTVSPSSLSFGLVDCGTAANHQTLTLTNSGGAMSFTAVFGKDASASYTLANDATGAAVPVATPIPVAAGGSFTLRVIPKPLTPPASTAANAFGDTLTITTTSPGDPPKIVQLNMTARGAFLRLNPVSIAGSDTECSHTKFYNFQVINDGNLPGDYTVAVVPRSGVSPSTFAINLASGSLFGGQSQAGILEMLTPTTKEGSTPILQYLGDIVLTPKAGTILCSDAQPKAPLSLDTPCHP